MAKSARASSVKSNKSRLRAKVFGPVEAARLERLSARIKARAQGNKTDGKDVVMDEAQTERDALDIDDVEQVESAQDRQAMDLDSSNLKKPSEVRGYKKSNSTLKRIEKAKARRKHKMVFSTSSQKKKKKASQ